MNSAQYQQHISTLTAELATHKIELNTYKQRCEQYHEAYELMRHQLQELLRYRFGRKSERFIDDEQLQASLFDLPVAETETPEPTTTVTVTAHQRVKKSAVEKSLPTRIDIIPVSDTNRRCACGCQKSTIGYESKTLLNYVPEVCELIEQRRERVACPQGCEGEVITAPAPRHILPKVKATESFLAFLITRKLDDRQPLYHLEKQLAARHDIDCSRQTMARWMIDLIVPLQPMFNLLKDEIIDYPIASCDATTLQVLQEPNRAATTKSQLYCMRGGSPEKPVILYEYNDILHKPFINDWFEGFEGTLHVDGGNCFDALGAKDTVQLSYCNAHARRKFDAVAKASKKNGLAADALRQYKALYRIEREASVQQLNPEQRHTLRQRDSKPLMEKFKQWLDEYYPTVLPQSPLGNAFTYCLNRWEGLSRFLDDGRLEIDNNHTEREIKPVVIARKNFLFCASVDGAKALSLHFSLLRTAKLHGLEPYHYYVTLLKSIPHCNIVADYEALLPWNMKINSDSSR